MEDSDPSENRKFRRFPAQIAIKFRCLNIDELPSGKTSKVAVEAVTGNVSEAGLYIKTNNLLPKGSILDIEFHNESSSHEIKVLGKVVWINEDESDMGLGIELIKTSEKEYKDIVQSAKRGQWSS